MLLICLFFSRLAFFRNLKISYLKVPPDSLWAGFKPANILSAGEHVPRDHWCQDEPEVMDFNSLTETSRHKARDQRLDFSFFLLPAIARRVHNLLFLGVNLSTNYDYVGRNVIYFHSISMGGIFSLNADGRKLYISI